MVPFMMNAKFHKIQSIFLIGPMGAGKSTIGRQIAEALNRDFYDSDEEVERRAGADLAWILDIEGEEGFRVRESRAISELTQKPGIVLATGGGAILDPKSAQLLSARGFVIYLKVSVQEQLQRTEYDKRRPVLKKINQTAARDHFFQEMQDARMTLYEDIADVVFTTDARTVKKVSKKVLDYLQQGRQA